VYTLPYCCILSAVAVFSVYICTEYMHKITVEFGHQSFPISRVLLAAVCPPTVVPLLYQMPWTAHQLTGVPTVRVLVVQWLTALDIYLRTRRLGLTKRSGVAFRIASECVSGLITCASCYVALMSQQQATVHF